MPMPAAIASIGERNFTGAPRSRISPASGAMRPNRMLIRVVLPAPFSPITPWISPRSAERSTRSLAASPPKRLTIPTASISGTAFLFRRVHRVGDLDRTVDDVIAQRLHLGDDVGIVDDRAFRSLDVGVEGGQGHAAFLEAECDNLRLRARHDAFDRKLDRDVGLLLDIVHHCTRGLRALVDVDAEGVDAGRALDCLEDAAVRSRACGEDAAATIAAPRSSPRAGSENGLLPPTHRVGEILTSGLTC